MNRDVLSDDYYGNKETQKKQVSQESTQSGKNRDVLSDEYGQLSIKPGFEKAAPILKIMAESGAGLPRFISDVATGLGEAGQNFSSTLSGQKTPRYDIKKSFGGEKGDPLTQAVSQHAIGVAGGGSTILGQMLSNAANKGLQYQPGEGNLLSALPESRATSMLEGALTGAIPFAQKPGLNLVKSGFNTGNPLLKAKIPQIKESIAKKELSLQEATGKHEAQKEAEQQVKTLSEEETGKAKPSTMQYSVLEQEKNLAEKSRKVEELNKQLEEHKKLPELPKIDTKSHDTNVSNAEKSLKEAEEHIENTKSTHEKSKENLESNNESIGEYLNAGKKHDELFAQQIKPQVEKIFEDIPANYKQVVDEFNNNNIQLKPGALENLSTMTPVSEEMNALVSGSEKTKIDKNHFVQEVMDIAPTSSDSNAGTFMDKLKDAKRYRFELKRRLKDESSAETRTQIIGAIPKINKIIENSEKALEKGIGTENYSKYEKVNKAYSDIFYPLKRNKVVKEILDNTTVTGKIAPKLRGTSKSRVLLREMTEANPEASKAVIGQSYSNKTKELNIHDPYIAEYIEKHPELKRLLNDNKEASQLIKQSESNIKTANKRKKEIERQHKEAVERKGKSESENKTVEIEKNKRESIKTDIEAQIEKHKKDISEGNLKVEKQNKHIESLRSESKKTKMTLKQKSEIENEIKKEKEKLSQLKKEINESKGKLFKFIHGSYRVAKGVTRVLKKIGK